VNIYDQLILGIRGKWIETPDKDKIPSDWWLGFYGYVPEDLEELSDAELLSLHILDLEHRIKELSEQL